MAGAFFLLKIDWRLKEENFVVWVDEREYKECAGFVGSGLGFSCLILVWRVV